MIDQVHNCGSLSKANVDQVVTLNGWINTIRVKKSTFFLDLRDRYGLTQIIIKTENENFENLKSLSNESVIQVTGVVFLRKTPNPKIKTGEIEINCQTITVLSQAQPLPFVINNENNFTALENLRLKYRYLDLRRKKMFDQLKFKHEMIQSIRNFLNQENFLEVDTPCLTKSTPEGARDFLVPSRIRKHAFYALPQSPQIYKQLLMIAGFDRYYQIAKCFRDEDFRADRQPEFQQLDLEISFASQNTVMSFVEKLLAQLWTDLKLTKLIFPLARLSYQEAVTNYGSDKPDLRCTCKLLTFPNLNNKLTLRGFWVTDKFNEGTKKAVLRLVEQHSSKNFLVYAKTKEQIIFSNNPQIKLAQEQLLAIKNSAPDDATICYLTYEANSNGAFALGAIRTYYCLDEEKQKNHDDFLANIKTYQLLWIVDWPMFELVDGKISAAHHPFTSPVNPEAVLEVKNDDYDRLLAIHSAAYDLVLNGYEIAGGSVRIFNKKLQTKIFEILNLNAKLIKEQFGFFLTAFDYGVPPHAGIAFGLDRFIMTLINTNSIRETIAFPKNNHGVDVLTDAPAAIDAKQLDELELKILNDK